LEVWTLVLKKHLRRSDRKGGKKEDLWLGPYRIRAAKEKGYQLETEFGAPLKTTVDGSSLKLYHEENKSENELKNLRCFLISIYFPV
jgi:hypothetical protein